MIVRTRAHWCKVNNKLWQNRNGWTHTKKRRRTERRRMNLKGNRGGREPKDNNRWEGGEKQAWREGKRWGWRRERKGLKYTGMDCSHMHYIFFSLVPKRCRAWGDTRWGASSDVWVLFWGGWILQGEVMRNESSWSGGVFVLLWERWVHVDCKEATWRESVYLCVCVHEPPKQASCRF